MASWLNPSEFEVLSRIRESGYNPSTPISIETLSNLISPGEQLCAFECFPSEDLAHTLSFTIPFIIERALSLTTRIPQFPSGTEVALVLPREDVLGILCAMFIGAVPHRGWQWPEPSFLPLLIGYAPQEVAKLRCVLEYFERARTDGAPKGVIGLRRVVVRGAEAGDLVGCEAALAGFELADGGIEDTRGALHADFANEYIGGGVLCGGCVQEEIRFAVCPENIVSLALFEKMAPGEAIIITGAEQFAATSGYMFGLRHAGPYRDLVTPRGPDGSVLVSLVAIDAIRFSSSSTDRGQIFGNNGDCAPLLREITKALAGFADPGPGTECSASIFPSISTGNWGCGVFNGDLITKAMVQWIAASIHGRKIVYHPFGDKRAEGLPAIISKFAGKKVKDLFGAIMLYKVCPHGSIATHLLSNEV